MNSNDYNDIINLPHHTSKKYPRMSIYKRSAQFAPFAALTGYSEAVSETARLTESKKRLTNDTKLILNEKLKYIEENLLNKENILITYFLPDKRKKGGKYISKKGIVKKIDLYNRKIIFTDKEFINIDDILKIDIN